MQARAGGAKAVRLTVAVAAVVVGALGVSALLKKAQRVGAPACPGPLPTPQTAAQSAVPAEIRTAGVNRTINTISYPPALTGVPCSCIRVLDRTAGPPVCAAGAPPPGKRSPVQMHTPARNAAEAGPVAVEGAAAGVAAARSQGLSGTARQRGGAAAVGPATPAAAGTRWGRPAWPSLGHQGTRTATSR